MLQQGMVGGAAGGRGGREGEEEGRGGAVVVGGGGVWGGAGWRVVVQREERGSNESGEQGENLGPLLRLQVVEGGDEVTRQLQQQASGVPHANLHCGTHRCGLLIVLWLSTCCAGYMCSVWRRSPELEHPAAAQQCLAAFAWLQLMLCEGVREVQELSTCFVWHCCCYESTKSGSSG